MSDAPPETAVDENAAPREDENASPREDENASPDADDASPEADDAFELLWSKVQEHWDDDKVHAAFLEYARARFQLPEAGARYRAIKEGDPARADVAQQKLQQLMVLALSMLEAARDQTPSSAPRWVSSIAFAVAAVFLAVLIRKVFAGP